MSDLGKINAKLERLQLITFRLLSFKTERRGEFKLIANGQMLFKLKIPMSVEWCEIELITWRMKLRVRNIMCGES